MTLDLNKLPPEEPAHTFSFAPNGGDVYATMYTDCHHRWWQKAKDWIRFRRHPEAHIVYHSKLYSAFSQTMTSGSFDLSADSIKIALIDNTKTDKDGEE